MLSSTGVEFEFRPSPRDHAPVVVFLHAGVADRHMWDHQLDALGEYHRVALDLRGFGGSGRPAGGPWTHAGDVLEVLDGLIAAGDLAAGPVHVVAASFGAGVAVEVALAHPERVASLVLSPPGGSLLVTMTPDLRAFIDAEDAALERGDLDAACAVNVATWAVGPGRHSADVPDALLSYVSSAQRRAFELEDLVGEPDEPDVDPAERLGELDLPVLVLTGAHDLDTTLDAADRIERDVAGSRRVTWPDAAHLPTLEHPDRATTLVRDWIAAH